MPSLRRDDIKIFFVCSFSQTCPQGFAAANAWYQPNTTSSRCIRVPKGFISGAKQSSSIQVPLGSKIRCTPVCDQFESCPAETKGTTPASLVCTPCVVGLTSLGGSLSCTSCDKGRFGVPGSRGGACDKCAPGHFQSVAGQQSCEKCPSGFSQPFAGSEACVDMKWKKPSDCLFSSEYLHNYGREQDWSCKRCPMPGGQCDVETTFHTLLPKLGYWNITWSSFWQQHHNVTAAASPFHQCKYKHSCLANSTCANGTQGVLCAVCAPNHVRRASQCLPCGSNDFGPSIAIFISVVCVSGLVIYLCRHRIRRFCREYGRLWRDVVRIVTINISYMQINSSLPSVMSSVEWPSMYLDFLESFNFVNLDLLNILGVPCVTSQIDFRVNIIVALCVPVIVSIVAAAMYQIRKSHITEKAAGIANDPDLQRSAAEFLFDVLDSDESGSIDLKEFRTLLHFLGMPDTTTKRMASQIMFRVRRHSYQVMRRASAGKFVAPGIKTYELSREQFVISICDGKLERLTKTGNGWIVVVEHERAATSYLSGVLVIFLLIHAPISQRFFYYFAEDNVGGKRFLHVDYSIEYYSDMWKNFLPVVLVLGVGFVFLLPLTIATLLYRHWSHLHSAHTKRKFGFLYRPFHVGAEWWECFELIRKMTLTGILIYFPPNVRTAAATLVCVVAVAILNFVQPHKRDIVFMVCECGYLLTTFKYLAAIFVLTKEAGALTVEEEHTLGILLIFIDVCMLCGSLIGFGAIVLLLRGGSVRGDVGGDVKGEHALAADFSHDSTTLFRRMSRHQKARRTSAEVRADKVRRRRRSSEEFSGSSTRRNSRRKSSKSTKTLLEQLAVLRNDEESQVAEQKERATTRILALVNGPKPTSVVPAPQPLSGRRLASSIVLNLRRSSSQTRRTSMEVRDIQKQAELHAELRKEKVKKRATLAKSRLSQRLIARSLTKVSAKI